MKVIVEKFEKIITNRETRKPRKETGYILKLIKKYCEHTLWTGTSKDTALYYKKMIKDVIKNKGINYSEEIKKKLESIEKYQLAIKKAEDKSNILRKKDYWQKLISG